MDEIRLDYEPPIRQVLSDISTKIEDDMVTFVQSYGFDVDKEELSRALVYDRDQYQRGYQQGRADAIREYKNALWEDIETRYKADIKILGYLSAEHLLRDVHTAINYFAEQLKEKEND